MQTKWMTREEFEKLKFTGVCWITHQDGHVILSSYEYGDYYVDNISDAKYDPTNIKAVIPIEKPEYPKEVG